MVELALEEFEIRLLRLEYWDMIIFSMNMAGTAVTAFIGIKDISFSLGGNNCHVFGKESISNLEA